MRISNKNFLIAASEILALALIELFPKTKIIGTYLTDLGFGIDFATEHTIDDTLFALIDERLRILIKRNLILTPLEMMRENAAEMFMHRQQEFLSHGVLEDPSNIVSLIRIGDNYGYSQISEDIQSGNLGAVKLIHYENLVADEECFSSIVSLEGVLCEDNKALKKFIKFWNEFKHNDYKTIGTELKLFFHPRNALPGNWCWLPKGQAIKDILISWWKDIHKDAGFSFISTSKWFQKTSHQSENRKALKFLQDNGALSEYASDDINILNEIFEKYAPPAKENSQRLAEIGEVFAPKRQRKNLGLFQEDVYTRDVAYSLSTEEQALGELISSLQFMVKSINMFVIDYQWYLVSSKPNSIENKGSRGPRVQLLIKALETVGLDYVEDLDDSLEGGPRIEARIIDTLEREWKGASLDVSFFPRKEEAADRRSNSLRQRSLLITRTLFGSLERFVALLVERFAGRFPLWLAPEQVRVLPVRSEHLGYARGIYETLIHEGVRASIDSGEETLAAKIFAVKSAKIPYAVVVGDSEQRDGTIAVCPCEDQGKGKKEKLSAFIEKLHSEIEAKTIPYLKQETTVE
jgi:threonyl-tRNA synthetase